MPELSHCEMQKEHYQAIQNPLYALEGLTDIMREELLMNMPVLPEVTDLISHNSLISQSSKEPQDTEEWTHRQWDYVKQLKAALLYFEKRLIKLEKKQEELVPY